jgi:Uma2 family endonuclease
MATQLSPVRLDTREMSFEEYLEAYDGVHAEWVDGRVYLMSPGNLRQSRLTRFLSAVVQHWAEAHDLGEAFVPPFGVRLNEAVVREPDVFFVLSAHLERLRDTLVEGAPDLVIEVVSPSSRGTDRGDKYYEYERAGVPEYWLIDPEREQVEAYRLGPAGRYVLLDLGEPSVLRSEVLPGMWIPVAWLWKQPLPKVTWVEREWGLI